MSCSLPHFQFKVIFLTLLVMFFAMQKFYFFR